jgi:carbamoyltransferase
MIILGISAFYHDSAAALLVGGRVVAAAQEERFTRKKHDSVFPHHSIEFCLRQAGISMSDVHRVVFYDKPLLKFERLLETYLAFAPRGFESFISAMPIWLREKLFLKDLLNSELKVFDSNFNSNNGLLFSEHHLSHAASAFYPSPFSEAVVLTIDGVGEWTTTSLAVGRDENLQILKEIHFPHSVGLLYSAFTYYIGFKVNSGEYKIMGLAPYGEPKYAQTILDNLIDLKPDGSFQLDMSFFDFCTGLRMTNHKFHDLFGGPPRLPNAPLTKRHMDLAASVQAVTEQAMLCLSSYAIRETGISNLCLAGGVALNCVGNGRILREGVAKKIWVQPAAGDAGGALGAAFVGHHMHMSQPRLVMQPDAMQGSYLGPAYTQAEIENQLQNDGAVFTVLSDKELFSICAQKLAEGKALGWFQGQMEFGPRALGNRSILADARSHAMQSLLNLKIKYRESFRPFAPAVLREHVTEWFELNCDSPYMLLVANVVGHRRKSMTSAEQLLVGIDKLQVPLSEIPAVTHIDYSARIQTVHAETNPRFHMLLTEFNARTACPVLVNTSFNVRGEPIVCTPSDAFHCFINTELDILAIGNCLLRKEDQDKSLGLKHKRFFSPD